MDIRDYVIELRRELHQCPEIGFDLPRTLAIVRRELDKMGIRYTERYGRSSIVATINDECDGKTLAMRADMDALPIHEDTGLPYSSLHAGAMHACGHDCHTAMLLGTAKLLKNRERELPCRVKLLFQAAEEYAPGGAKLMCDDGVMEGVDCIIGCHVSVGLDPGKIAFNYGKMYAQSHGFILKVKGKSCHVCSPQCGVDAIAMATQIYTDIQFMRAREIDPKMPCIIGIGEIHGGRANNVVCDEVMMHGTIRTVNEGLDDYIYKRIGEIADAVTSQRGGGYELTTTKNYPLLKNDPDATERLAEIAKRLLGTKNVYSEKVFTMGAEDFAFYRQHAPGVFFNLGAGRDDDPIAPAHNSKFVVDESGLEFGPKLFVEYAMSFK